MLHNVLKYTWIILVNEDKSWRFNVYNPIAWAVLLVVSMCHGFIEGWKSMFNLIGDVVSDAVKPQVTGVPKAPNPLPPPPARPRENTTTLQDRGLGR